MGGATQEAREGEVFVHHMIKDGSADNVGSANYMLSYTWGYSIGDIVDTLVDFCESTKQSPKRVYVWMCCLCVNQHRVVALSKQGKLVPFEQFSETFYQRVNGIKNILSMMTTWDDPGYLKRVWCIFEMYVATTSTKCNVTILMPPGEKYSFAKEIENGSGGEKFFEVLSKTDIENASATSADDKKLIMRAVNEGPGAHSLNVRINDLLIEWSKAAVSDVIEVRENDCDDYRSDQDFARFLRKVGLLFWKQGFYENALEQQSRALDIQKRVLGDMHAQTAQTYNDIGMTYSNLSRPVEATKHCKRALEIRREILGEIHKDTAASYSTVAMRLKGMGELDEALTMVLQALATRQQLYKMEAHADICRSQITVGRILAARNEHEEAIKYFHKAVDTAQAENVKDTRLEARALDDMGCSYEKMGKTKKALESYTKCLTIREIILGSNHKLTIKIRDAVQCMLEHK